MPCSIRYKNESNNMTLAISNIIVLLMLLSSSFLSLFIQNSVMGQDVQNVTD